MSRKSAAFEGDIPEALAFKPDLQDAADRWAAFLHGEIVDRPVVCVTAPREGYAPVSATTYRDRVSDDMDSVLDRIIRGAEATFHGGEAIPAAWLSFGPDEIACFCGAELKWSKDSGDTNWSHPFVEEWDAVLPLRVDESNPLWRRMLALCRKAAERTAGKMLVTHIDLHSNMDLLASLRGPERLRMDLLDKPETIDRAMASARAIFPIVWNAIAEAAKMRERGFCHTIYAREGAAYLQCDFSCMIGPDMFERWVLPALEEEAGIVGHTVYHWDGPGALVHAESLIRSVGLHTLSYVPGAGRGSHLDYVDLLRRVQEGGKAIEVWGSADQLKQLHRLLRPEKTLYRTWAKSVSEAEELLIWFKENT